MGLDTKGLHLEPKVFVCHPVIPTNLRCEKTWGLNFLQWRYIFAFRLTLMCLYVYVEKLFSDFWSILYCTQVEQDVSVSGFTLNPSRIPLQPWLPVKHCSVDWDANSRIRFCFHLVSFVWFKYFNPEWTVLDTVGFLLVTTKYFCSVVRGYKSPRELYYIQRKASPACHSFFRVSLTWPKNITALPLQYEAF